jgi:putative peptidoglycan lipid II flippase
VSWAATLRHVLASPGTTLRRAVLCRQRKTDRTSAPIVGGEMAGVSVQDKFPAPFRKSAADDSRKPSGRRLATILMSGALMSKVLGFAREVLMAQVLGASLVADGFRGAITAVMIPLAFLQNESVPAILIPMHRDSQKNGDAPQRLAALSLALTLAAIALMLATEALGGWWVDAVVGGFVPESQALTLEFVRIMALGMPASVMLNCLAAGEIALGRSRLTNIRASLLNISVLVGVGLLALTGRLSALAWAFTIAFNALGIFAVWSLWRDGSFSLAGVTPAMIWEAAAEFLRRLRPLLALPTAEQGNVWIERALASRLATGSVASLDYARTLTESALLLISQPVGLAVLSSYPTKDTCAQIEAIARPVLAVTLPASAFLFVFAPEVVRLVFFRGAFTEAGVLLTSQALRGISIGLWAATLGWILLRILNSTGRNGMAAIIIVSAYAANAAVNLLTSGIQETSGAGTLLLGLGEAARSLVLLAGVVLALKCRARIACLIAMAMIPALMMTLVGWKIHEVVAGTLERLLVGGMACVACMALAAAILMPLIVRESLRKSAAGFRS